jgi:predicted nucleic acid-binding protein
MMDCLIAAMAIREARPLLARDRDYEIIAGVTELRLVVPGAPGA